MISYWTRPDNERRFNAWREQVVLALELERAILARGNPDQATESVSVSGYYEDDTVTIELPYTPADTGSNLIVSVSGQSSSVPSTQAYVFEYAFGSAVTHSGTYSYSYEPNGPVVTPPETAQGQMLESGGCSLSGVSGLLFQPASSGSALDWSACFIETSGLSVQSADEIGQDQGFGALVESSGYYLLAGASSLSDHAATSGVSVSGLHFIFQTFASGSDAATSSFISVSGSASASAEPVSGDWSAQSIVPAGVYADGSQESVLPQEFGDSDRPFNRVSVSGDFVETGAILDESGDFILDESGEPLLEES